MVESRCTQNGKDSYGRRFYKTAFSPHAMKLGGVIRGHWSIDINLHIRMLDLDFDDPSCTVRDRNASRNVAIFNHLAYNILKESARPHSNNEAWVECASLLASVPSSSTR